MRISRWIINSAIVAAIALLVGISLQHVGAAGAGKARPPKSTPDPLIQQAARLARPGIVDEGVNMLSLTRQVFDLDEEQKQEFNELAEQRNVEARRLIKQLNERYNERAEAALDADQKQTYDAIASALEDFRTKVLAALEDLEEVGGKPLAEWGRRAGRGQQLDVQDLLDLNEEQQKKMQQYETESRAAQQKARQSVARPQDRTDEEAMRQYQQQIKQDFQQIQQDYKQKVEKLFTPEQQQRLQEIQRAVQQYANTVKQAQRAYVQQIKKSLNGK